MPTDTGMVSVPSLLRRCVRVVPSRPHPTTSPVPADGAQHRGPWSDLLRLRVFLAGFAATKKETVPA